MCYVICCKNVVTYEPGGGTPASGGTPAAPEAGSGAGAGSMFAPGVIQVTPQDKEAIERVRYFILLTFVWSHLWNTSCELILVITVSSGQHY